MVAAKREGAGALNQVVAFQVRSEADDGYGNPITGEYATQFFEPCRLQPLKGGEPVLAARLTKVQPYVLRVRSSARTRRVGVDWRAVNTRTGAIYNIKTISNIDERGAYLDMMAVEGEAT
ncbi:head-tail adaptor protein [Bosea sp. AS-1]|uniref:head-tail adaptor protein n=1 Tax=Bosea sp. AS-1 TaxID=2015316 RepID=UPI000B798637|nr:head-tail adaptor protein [Bosea sp. AS-1]